MVFRPHSPCSATRRSRCADASATSWACTRSSRRSTAPTASSCRRRRRRASSVGAGPPANLGAAAAAGRSSPALCSSSRRYDQDEGGERGLVVGGLCREEERRPGEVRARASSVPGRRISHMTALMRRENFHSRFSIFIFFSQCTWRETTCINLFLRSVCARTA